MALPQQLKAARMTNATAASSIDDEVGNLEKALADIFGLPLDTDITRPFNSGTKYATISDSNTVASTTAQTAFNKSFVIPANSLKVGDWIRVHSEFVYNLVAGPSSHMYLMVTLNGTYITYLDMSGSGVGGPINYTASLLVRSLGASGSTHFGMLIAFPLPIANVAGGTSQGAATLNTTIDNTISWAAQPGVSDAGNNAKLVKGLVDITPASSTG